VLAAADMLHRELPAVTIDIAGTFDDPRYARAAAARPNIRRLGYVESETLAAMMPGYLAPLYLPNVESFGLAAVEAMAAGLPVIACRSTAVPETAGDAAISVDHASPMEVVRAVEQLQRSAEHRAAWVARGQARAAEFTWPACVDRLAQSLT